MMSSYCYLLFGFLLIKLFSKNKLMRRFKNYFENDSVQYNEDGAWNIE